MILKQLGLTAIIIFILAIPPARCAVPDTLWSTRIGGPAADQFRKLVPTPDYGYLLCGFTESYGNGMSDAHLVKCSSDGEVLWQKTYGGASIEYANDIIPVDGGGYLVAGATYSRGSGLSDLWLVRIDSNGDSLWTKTYGGASFDEGYAVAQTADGGFIIAGQTSSSGAGGKDFWLLKTDTAGDTAWTRTYGGTGNEQPYSVCQALDGGYTLAGYTSSLGSGSNSGWLMHTDAAGASLWNEVYGGVSSDVIRHIVELPDSGFFVTAHTASFGGLTDAWLLRTDVHGDTLWGRRYGGADHDYVFNAAVAADGGMIVAGKTSSYGAGKDDLWLLRTDMAGDTLWTATYGGGDNEIGYTVVQNADRSFTIGGEKRYNGNYDLWLIRVGFEGAAPQNDMTLTASTLSRAKIGLAWNPGSITDMDVDSVAVWYRTGRYPAYVFETGAELLGVYALSDSADTAAGLEMATEYYFSLVARSTDGLWSDTTSAANDTAITLFADTLPPDNDMTLIAVREGGNGVRLSWNPGQIDSVDADSVGIWYQKVDYPDSANDPASIRIAGFILSDSSCIVENLDTGTVYYLALLVRDSSGNWSDTVGTACDTALTNYPEWWDTDWRRRISLSFRNSFLSDTLENMPVLVKFFDGRTDYDNFKLDGADIRFVENNNVTSLPYEIESWDASGTSYVWVQVPDILPDGNADSIWLYYDNAGAVDGQDVSGTWNSDFTGVWHLNEDVTDEASGGLHYDATAGNHDGIQNGNSANAGLVSNGQYFDGINDYISLGDHDEFSFGNGLSDSPFSISMWVNMYNSAACRFISKADMGVNANREFYFLTTAFGNLYFRLFDQSTGGYITRSVTSPLTGFENQWIHLAASYDGTGSSNGMKIFINGVRADDASLNSGIYTALENRGHSLEFGGLSTLDYYNGELDEVRISNVQRNEDWVDAEYRSATDSLIEWGLCEVDGDTTAPENTLTLTVTALSETTIQLAWNPGVLNNADADSIGIWYRMDQYPGGANEEGAVKVAVYSIIDSVDTLYGFERGVIFYFSAVVRDTMDNWSDTVGTACDTACIQFSDWWDAGWMRRVSLLFDNSFLSDTLDSFPVLVKLFDGRIDYNDFRAGGADIRFVKKDNLTELPYEIESWNVSGTSYVWVNVLDILPGGNADSIWLYYDNAGAMDNQDTAGTWSNCFTGVWHLNENVTNEASGGIHYDASAGNHDGIQHGNSANNGQVSDGQYFDGVNDYISLGDQDEFSFGNGLSDSPFSISMLVNMHSSAACRFMSKADMGVNANREFYFLTTVYGNLYFRLFDQSTGGYITRSVTSPLTIYENQWIHLAATYNGTGSSNGMKIYIDGVRADDASSNSGIYTAMENRGHSLEFGGISTLDYYNGELDEVRISNVQRNEDWVNAEYRSAMDSLIEWGAQAARGDTVPPDNDFTLIATALSDISILLTWTPGDIDSTDADSVGIWYSTSRYPGKANESGANRMGIYALTDSVDTLWGLDVDSIYYFCSMVRDTAGNWSDTAGTACDAAQPAYPVWWDTDWMRRVSLLFDNSFLSGSLDNFPVLVKLFDGRIDYNDFRAGGSDIRFVKKDNLTELPYEIESWNASGTSYVWVQVPDILPGGISDSIWLYYDNAGAIDGQDVPGTWNNGFTGVWHLNEDVTDEASGGIHYDATAGNHGGIQNGNSADAGQVSNGQYFDGVNDYISLGDQDEFSFGNGISDAPFSMSMWVNMHSSAACRFVSKADMGVNANREFYFITTAFGNLYFRLFDQSTGGYITRSVTAPLTGFENQWIHLAAIYDGTGSSNGMKLYINGVRADDASLNSGNYIAMENRGHSLEFGGLSTLDYYNGELDEVRLSNVQRNGNWVNAEYRSAMDSLIEWGSYDSLGDIVPVPKRGKEIPEIKFIKTESDAGELRKIVIHPFPARSRSIITFTIPEYLYKVHAEIVVFSLNGDVLAVLLDDYLVSGEHALSWDLRDQQGKLLPQGIYYYQYSCAGRNVNGSIVIIR